jgi:MSHA biogenesis protein MshK
MKPGAVFLLLAATTGVPMWAADAAAQIMDDPTRPPVGMLAPDAGTVSADPVLQSVMITPSGRSAIIGGERVRLGGKYGEARVISITESEVVLRSTNGTETLRMYPDITMKRVESAPPANARPAKKRSQPAPKPEGKQG